VKQFRRSHGFRRARREIRNSGFTYLSLLILIAIIGIVSTASLQIGVFLQRHAAEEELLEIGAEFRNALISYANSTPAGHKRTPSSLQDLLKDPRYPNPRRHLRKLYIDPITGKDEWGILELSEGSGIIGVHSLSDKQPIKIGNFDAAFQDFAGKSSYMEWKFMPPIQHGLPSGLSVQQSAQGGRP
jgi:type II secretory pathway pseudopilin PulG